MTLFLCHFVIIFKMFVYLHRLTMCQIMSEKIEREGIKTALRVLAAIIAALLGALGEASTHILNHLIF